MSKCLNILLSIILVVGLSPSWAFAGQENQTEAYSGIMDMVESALSENVREASIATSSDNTLYSSEQEAEGARKAAENEAAIAGLGAIPVKAAATKKIKISTESNSYFLYDSAGVGTAYRWSGPDVSNAGKDHSNDKNVGTVTYCISPNAKYDGCCFGWYDAPNLSKAHASNKSLWRSIMLAALYFGVGGPAYTSSWYPKSTYNGGEMTYKQRFATTHMLTGSLHLGGVDKTDVSSKYKSWFKKYVFNSADPKNTSRYAGVLLEHYNDAYMTSHGGYSTAEWEEQVHVILTDSKHQDFLTYIPLKKGKLSITKVSQRPRLTKNNSSYSLKGAVYGVFETKAKAETHNADKALATYKTDANGKITTGNNYTHGKTYYIAEIKPSKGFERDDTIHKVTVSTSTTKNVKSTEPVTPKPVEVAFKATKKLEHGKLAANQFSFQLKDSSGKVLQTKKNNAAGNIPFSAITYDFADVGKTFTYKVNEVASNNDKIVYDTHIETITVKVALKNDVITPTVTYSSGSGGAVFTNEEKSANGTIKVKKVDSTDTSKTLKGAKFAVYKGSFSSGEAAMSSGAAVQTVVTAANGTASFTNLPLGTYTVVETQAPGGYYLNGEDTGTVERYYKVANITEAAPNVDLTGTPAQNLSRKGSVVLEATKEVSGMKLSGGEFTFKLEAVDAGAPMPSGSATAVNDSSGNVRFPKITYQTSDGGHTYRYRISEVPGDNPRVTYDGRTYIASVRVVNGEQGIMTHTEYSLENPGSSSTIAAGAIGNFLSPVIDGLAGLFLPEKAYAATATGDKVEVKLTGLASPRYFQTVANYEFTAKEATYYTLKVSLSLKKSSDWENGPLSGSIAATGQTTKTFSGNTKAQVQGSSINLGVSQSFKWTRTTAAATKTITAKVSRTYNGKTYTSTAKFTVSIPAKAKYTITYHPNGGSGSDSTTTYYYGDAVTTRAAPTRSNYSFYHWNSTSTNTGTYTAAASKSYTPNPPASFGFYAIWNPIITFNANGGSGAPSAQTKTYGSALTLSSTKPTRTGYTFSKWNTAANGSGTNYNSGGTVAAGSNTALTLYAQWTVNTYNVQFNANGGTGTMANESFKYSDTTKALTKLGFTRTGYVFTGWATSADGKAVYDDMEVIKTPLSATNGATVNLYAVWVSEDTLGSTVTGKASFFNEMEPRIGVKATKVDSDNATALAGAKFEIVPGGEDGSTPGKIYNEAGQEIQSLTIETGADGIAATPTSALTLDGSFAIREISAPDGYALKDPSWHYFSSTIGYDADAEASEDEGQSNSDGDASNETEEVFSDVDTEFVYAGTWDDPKLSASVELPVEKQFTYQNGTSSFEPADFIAGEFYFELREGSPEAEVISTVSVDNADASGKSLVSFPAIQYNEEGEHDYYITEKSLNPQTRITYAETHKVHVSVHKQTTDIGGVTATALACDVTPEVAGSTEGSTLMENVYHPGFDAVVYKEDAQQHTPLAGSSFAIFKIESGLGADSASPAIPAPVASLDAFNAAFTLDAKKTTLSFDENALAEAGFILIDTIKSADDGYAATDNNMLDAGSAYAIVETKAADGYVLKDTPTVYLIDDLSPDGKYSHVNRPAGIIFTEAPAAGEEAPLVNDIQTNLDSNGRPAAACPSEEQSQDAWTGYKLELTQSSADLSTDAAFQFSNNPSTEPKGGLGVRKVDADTGEGLAGAAFTIYDNQAFTDKLSAYRTAHPGASDNDFYTSLSTRLIPQENEADGEMPNPEFLSPIDIELLETDNDGWTKTGDRGLDPGTYRVIETKAPFNYEDPVYDFDAANGGASGNVVIEVQANEVNLTATPISNKANLIPFEMAISVQKTLEGGSTEAGKYSFGVYHVDDTEYSNPIAQATNAADGSVGGFYCTYAPHEHKWTLRDASGTVLETLENVDASVSMPYVIREIIPDDAVATITDEAGEVKEWTYAEFIAANGASAAADYSWAKDGCNYDAEPHELMINIDTETEDAEDVLQAGYGDEDSEDLGYMPIVNTLDGDGSIKFKKDDGNGNPVGGAVFEITGTSTAGQSVKIECSSDEDTGIVSAENIPRGGPYTVRETVPAEGYILNTGWTLEFSINGEGDELDLDFTADEYTCHDALLEYLDIPVSKHWLDGEAHLSSVGSYSDVTVTLHGTVAGGEPIERSLVLGEDNGWSGVFEHLPKTDVNGTPYVYTVDEISVDGWDTVKQGNIENGFQFYNVLKVSKTVHKTWKDYDNKWNTRPAQVTFLLKRKGSNDIIQQKVVSAGATADEWSATFENLPGYDLDNNAIEYVVEEEAVDGYDSEIRDDGNGGYAAVNTLKEISIPVSKVWNDNSNANNRRPSATFTLGFEDPAQADKVSIPQEKMTLTLGPDQASGSFTGLPAYDSDGNVVRYKVDEVAPSDPYALSGQTGNYLDGYTFTNEELGSLVVEKKVEGASAKAADKKFPFTLVLTDKDGQPVSKKFKATLAGNPVEVGATYEFELADKEKLVVEGIPKDTHYAVTEGADKPGFSLSGDKRTQDGTIEIGKEAAVSFTNVYATSASWTPKAKKMLNRALKDGEFSFTISGGNLSQAQTSTSNASGEVSFPEISYTQADDGKEYTYTIREEAGNAAEIAYDSHEETVKVSISDNGEGVLSIVYNGYSEDNPPVFTNTVGSIRTTATDAADGDKFLFQATGQAPQKIRDTVAYEGLRTNTDYVMKASVVDRQGKAIEGIAPVEKPFKTGNEANGSVDVEIEVDLSKVSSDQVVVYEELSLNGSLVAEHKDTEDAAQTVNVIKISTVAKDAIEGNHYITAASPKIVDTVTFSGLDANASYIMKATLMKKGANVEESGLTGEREFTPGTASSIDVEIPLSADKLTTGEYVVYEALYAKDAPDKKLAYHEEADDKYQTVNCVSIKTTAIDALEKDHYIKASSETSVMDLIAYEGLKPDHKYIVETTIVKKVADKTEDVASKSALRTEQTSSADGNGTFNVPLPVAADELVAGEYVIYETVYDGEDSDTGKQGDKVAEHSEVGDFSQTFNAVSIATEAKDDADGDRVISGSESADLTDYVNLSGLKVEHAYRLEATLMNKATGEAATIAGQPIQATVDFKMPDKAVSGEGTATESGIYSADGAGNGVAAVKFKIDLAELEKGEYVFFERLYDTEKDSTKDNFDGNDDSTDVVAVHEDINDEKQTVNYVSMGTHARDDADMDHYVTGDKADLTDYVDVSGFRTGHKYILNGTLMDKQTGKPVEIDGKKVEASVEFTMPTEAVANPDSKEAGVIESDGKGSGVVALKLSVDLTKIETGDYVFFETILDAENTDNTVVVKHEDLNDESQTIHYVKIGTEAQDDSDGDHYVSGGSANITDYVSLWGLRTDHKYTLEGKLMDKQTGKPVTIDGKEITSSTEVDLPATPLTAVDRKGGSGLYDTDGKGNGVVGVQFAIDFSKLETGEYVFFEYLQDMDKMAANDTTPADDKATTLVASHEDLNDEAQIIRYVSVATQAKDKADGDKDIKAEDNAGIIDTVAYTGLAKDSEYVLRTYVYDKQEAKTIDLGGKEYIDTPFKATDEGKVDIPVEFNSREHAEHELVVFEELYSKDMKLIADHKNPDDADQTVRVGKDTSGLADDSQKNEQPATTPSQPAQAEQKATPSQTPQAQIVKTEAVKQEVTKTGDGFSLDAVAASIVLALGAAGVLTIRRRKQF